MNRKTLYPVVCAGLLGGTVTGASAELLGEGPGLKAEDRISQAQIENGELSLIEIREAGLRIFTTPFNRADGFGDGDHDPGVFDQVSPGSGNRPSLQGNGTFLRVNGLDAQTCLECHTVVSNRTVPATLGIGGAGGLASSPMFQPGLIDVGDSDFDGNADFDGRLINPPFLFGSGGVELLGLEMTEDLQKFRQQAIDNPNTVIDLETKGVYFGSIVANDAGEVDVSNIEGVDSDLVVRPFGRKGEFATVREFGVGAMAFHFGMQATEAFGENADADHDGVFDEITVGDMSAMSIFLTTLERPVAEKPKRHREGLQLFEEVGCADCHVPSLQTERTHIPYKLTGNPESPFADSFHQVDLTKPPMAFRKLKSGGVEVPLFSDLKRHDMGEELAESFGLVSEARNREFITPRLWGIADTAPYMHDGRALTLAEAIAMHDSAGGEAVPAAQEFAALPDADKNKILAFLLSLRTPDNPARDVVSRGKPREQAR